MEKIIGIGDIKMSEVIKMDSSKALNMFRNRFAAYRKLVNQIGEDAAYEKMMKGYPEQQKAFLGAFIDHATLAEGFNDAIPIFRIMGFDMKSYDVSQDGKDAVLEIQKVCPVLAISQEYGFESPCKIVCEIEQDAIKKAFPDIKADILSRKANGDCVCIFKYERPIKKKSIQISQEPNIFVRILDLILLSPKILQMGINLIKNRLS
jgi:predicted ArsR family transcriptional regulator